MWEWAWLLFWVVAVGQKKVLARVVVVVKYFALDFALSVEMSSALRSDCMQRVRISKVPKDLSRRMSIGEA